MTYEAWENCISVSEVCEVATSLPNLLPCILLISCRFMLLHTLALHMLCVMGKTTTWEHYHRGIIFLNCFKSHIMLNACINPTRTRTFWGYFSTALSLIIIFEPVQHSEWETPVPTTRIEYPKSHLHRSSCPNERWVGGRWHTLLFRVYVDHCTQTKEGMVVSAISRHLAPVENKLAALGVSGC